MAARLAGIAAKAGAVLIDVNPADSELRELALRSTGGAAVASPASTALPAIDPAVVETHARAAPAGDLNFSPRRSAQMP